MQYYTVLGDGRDNALVLCFSGPDRFYGLCVQLSHGCALLEPGDLWDTISSALE